MTNKHETSSVLAPAELRRMVADWEKFYKQFFNRKIDFSSVIIPKRPTKKHRLEIIAKGTTVQKIANVWPIMSMSDFSYSYNDKVFRRDFDKVVPEHYRVPTQHYAVWVLHRVEPDAQSLGQMVQNVDPKMNIGITLIERLVLELKYCDETGGNHLDIVGATMCSGSRDKWGGVPIIYWHYNRDQKGDTPGIYTSSIKPIEVEEKSDGIRTVVTN